MSRGIHTLPNKGLTQEWLTPPHIINAFGPFDLDPCAPIKRPWPTAKKHYTVEDDGLSHKWDGLVWLNPPYSAAECYTWLERLADHGTGMALVAVRTETTWFSKQIWNRATSALFLNGRLYFYDVNGNKAKGNAGHGSVLVAYGAECAARLWKNHDMGTYVSLNEES